MQRVFVIAAKRTPVGRLGGALQQVQPDDLLLPLFHEILGPSSISSEQIDEVIIGQAKQTQDHANIARKVLLKAGLPESVPGYTVNRQCGSGMQSIHDAYLRIRLGLAHSILAGGVESMSTAPYYLRQARFGYRTGNAELLDPNKESQPGSQDEATYGRLIMGMTAENLAEKYHISREEQDEFALHSQEKAWQAIERGDFANEIVPLPVPQRKGEPILFSVDEHPRKTSLNKLAKLPPAFKENGTVTAGNSSGLNDGASLLLLVSEKKLRDLDISPMAEIVGLGTAGVSPKEMGIGPIPATKQALKMANLSLDDLDLIELNEAFAAQSLAVLKELPVSKQKVNVHGGAIALGHPIGNSGARISVTLLHAMKKYKSQYGLATLCIAGGQGIATIFKSLKGA